MSRTGWVDYLQKLSHQIEKLFYDYMRTTRHGERLVTFVVIIRLVFFYGAVLRFGISHPTNPTMDLAAQIILWLTFAYIILWGYICLNHAQFFFSLRSKTLQIILDTLFASALYLFAQDIQSDLFLLYLVPLLLASDYLDLLPNLAVFLSIAGLFSGASYASSWLAGSPLPAGLPTLILGRLSFLALFTIAFWVLRRLSPALYLSPDRRHLVDSLEQVKAETYIVGEKRRLIWVSPGLRARHGVDYASQRCFEYIAGRSAPCVTCRLGAQGADASQSPYQVTTRARDTTGEVYDAELTITPSIHLGGMRAIVQFRDLRALKHYEGELETYAGRVDELVADQARQLTAQAQRISSQVTSLFEATRRLSTMADLPDREALEAILARFAQQMDCTGAVMRTLDRYPSPAPQLVARAEFGVPEERKSTVAILPYTRASLVWKALETRQPQTCLDVQNSASSIFFSDLAQQDGLRSMASFPLLLHGRAVGTCTFYRDRVAPFTESEIALGQTMAGFLAITLDDLQMYREQRRRTDERQSWLDVLRELDEALATYEPPESTMHRALSLIQQRLQAETVAFFLWEGGRLRRKAIVGLPVDWFVEEGYGYGEGLTGEALVPPAGQHHGQHVICNQVDQDPRVLQPNLQRYQQALPSHQVKHLLAVPLNDRTHSFGVLRIVNRVEGTGLSAEGFLEADVYLLRIIATQVAMAIENLHLFEEERARRKLAEQLAASALTMTSSLQLPAVLEQILDQVGAVVPYDSASIQILEGAGFHVLACRGFENPEEVMRLVFPDTEAFPNSRVLRQEGVYILADAPLTYRHFADPCWHSTHIRSWMGVPLRYRDKPLGMISIDSKTPGFYREEHARLAAAFAPQAAGALENARLYERTRQQAVRNELLVRAAREWSGLTDLPRLADLIVESALAVIDKADEAVLHIFDSATGQLVPWACRPTQGRTLPQAELALGRGIAGLALQMRTTLNVPDVTQEGQFVSTAVAERLRSLLVAPLHIGEKKLVGTLSLSSTRTAMFDQEDAHFLTMLASLAGTSWANTELWQAREERRKQVEAILEAVQDFDPNIGIAELCRRILQTACRVLDWQVATIKIVEPEKGSYTIVTAAPGVAPWVVTGRGTPPFQTALQQALTAGTRLGRCSLVPEGYAQMRQRIVREELPLPDAPAAARAWSAGDCLIIPLDTDLATVGYLALASPARQAPPATDEIQLIEFLAAHAAVAIARACLYEETAAREEQLQTYLAVLEPQLESFDQVEALAPFLVQTVTGLLGAQGCAFYHVPAEGQIECVATEGQSVERVPPGPVAISDERGAGLAAYVAKTREALSFTGEAFRHHPAYNAPLEAGAAAASGALLLRPIVDQGNNVAGVLEVYKQSAPGATAEFSPAEQSLLDVLVRRASAGLQRFRLKGQVAKEERARLEAELHEAMNVLATGVRWEVGMANRALGKHDWQELDDSLGRIESSSKRAYEDLLYILRDMGKPVLREHGLVRALQEYAAEVGQDHVLINATAIGRLPLPVEYTLYRIAQESISNALKYSGIQDQGGQVQVDVHRQENLIQVSVADNGIGFEVGKARERKGPTGLKRMAEWAADSGVNLTIVSAPGQGTRVVAQVYELKEEQV